ncbi:MAG: hypothetical protein V1692_02060 [bacterium]
MKIKHFIGLVLIFSLVVSVGVIKTAKSSQTAGVGATVTVYNLSVDMDTDGVIAYGNMDNNTSKTTLDLSDAQIAGNNGTPTEDFNIMGQDSANWELGDTADSNQYIHKFCNDTVDTCDSPPTSYTAFNEDGYTTMASDVTASSSITFQLEITTPNPSTYFTQQTVDVTVQAVLAT